MPLAFPIASCVTACGMSPGEDEEQVVNDVKKAKQEVRQQLRREHVL